MNQEENQNETECIDWFPSRDNGYVTRNGQKAMPFDFGGFEELLTAELIPKIDSAYRTRSDRDHRALAGLSMGGVEALECGLTHLDFFASVAAFSAPVFGRFDVKTKHNGAFENPDDFNKKVRLLWLEVDTTEGFADGVTAIHSALDKAGVRHVILESQGTSHEWLTWRRSFYDFARRLFRD